MNGKMKAQQVTKKYNQKRVEEQIERVEFLK